MIGAPGESSSTTGVNSVPNEGARNSGAVYVFQRAAGRWSQEAYLKPDASSEAGAMFGGSVAISLAGLIAGAPNENGGNGAAYLFARNGAGWRQQARVSGTQPQSRFGASVAISLDTAVVGAPDEDAPPNWATNNPNRLVDAGAVYVYSPSIAIGTWAQAAKLSPAAANVARWGFGAAVAISGNTIVAGAPGESSSALGVNHVPNTDAPNAGVAFVYVRNNLGTWRPEASLKPAAVGPTQAGDFFGNAVAIDGDFVVIGAPGEDGAATGINGTPNDNATDSGAAYVFRRSGSSWTQTEYLKPASIGFGQARDTMGASVAISKGSILAGSPGENGDRTELPNEGALGAGAAYWFTGAVNPIEGLRFVPIKPCRVADSRVAGFSFTGPIGARGSRQYYPAGDGLLLGCTPAYARAYAVNVTVIPRGPLGYITVWPSGKPQPATSTLNSLDGRVKAVSAIVEAGHDKTISVYATDWTDVVIDVTGYFVASSDSEGLAFYPLTPCRISDTRNAAGPLGCPSLVSKAKRSIPVLSSGCGIPASAKAYSLNATAVPRQTLGYLTLWPTGVAEPLLSPSTLNATTGTVVANAAIIMAGADGSIDVFATDETHLILDVNGYFAPPGSPGELKYYPVGSCRVSDTRLPAGPFGGPGQGALAVRDYEIPSSACEIPATAKAYALNATVVPSGLFGYLALWPAGSARPTISTLNAVDGALTSNAAIVPAGSNGAISAFGSELFHLLLDISGYFAP